MQRTLYGPPDTSTELVATNYFSHAQLAALGLHGLRVDRTGHGNVIIRAPNDRGTLAYQDGAGEWELTAMGASYYLRERFGVAMTAADWMTQYTAEQTVAALTRGELL